MLPYSIKPLEDGMRKILSGGVRAPGRVPNQTRDDRQLVDLMFQEFEISGRLWLRLLMERRRQQAGAGAGLKRAAQPAQGLTDGAHDFTATDAPNVAEQPVERKWQVQVKSHKIRGIVMNVAGTSETCAQSHFVARKSFLKPSGRPQIMRSAAGKTHERSISPKSLYELLSDFENGRGQYMLAVLSHDTGNIYEQIEIECGPDWIIEPVWFGDENPFPLPGQPHDIECGAHWRAKLAPLTRAYPNPHPDQSTKDTQWN